MHIFSTRALVCAASLFLTTAAHAEAPDAEHYGTFQVDIGDDFHGHDHEADEPGAKATLTHYYLVQGGRRSRIDGLDALSQDERRSLPRSGTAVRFRGKRNSDGTVRAYGGPQGPRAPTAVQSSYPAPVLGSRSVLVAIVGFTDVPNPHTAAAIDTLYFNGTPSVASALAEASYGKLTVSGTVRPPIALNRTMGSYCDYYGWSDATDAALRASGTEPNNYNHVVYILPSSAPCAWTGLGTMFGRTTWILAPEASLGAHEIGHNLGFDHAAFNGQESYFEYGDETSFMGAPTQGVVLAAPHRYQAGWLEADAVGLVTESGTYEMGSLDTPYAGRQQLLLLPDERTPGLSWFISLRTPVNGAADMYLEKQRGPSIHRFGPGSGQLSLFHDALDGVGDVWQVPEIGLQVRNRYVDHDSGWVDVTRSCATFERVSNAAIWKTDLSARRFTFRVKNRTCDGASFVFDPGAVAPGWTTSSGPVAFTLARGATRTFDVDVTPTAAVTYDPWKLSAPTTQTATLTTGEQGLALAHSYAAHLYSAPPSAPERVSIIGSASKTKTIEWYPANNVAPIVSYELWRRLSNGTIALRATVAASNNYQGVFSYTDNHGTQSTPPAYWVVAVDEGGLRSTRSLFVGTLPAGAAPVVVNDTLTVPYNGMVMFNPLANDSDPNGDALVIINVGGMRRNSAGELPFGQIRVTPRPDRLYIYGYSAGTRVLSYEAYDSMGRVTAGTITVTVQAATNPLPFTRPDNASTPKGEPIEIDVIANELQYAGTQQLRPCSVGPAYYEDRVMLGSVAIVNGRVRYTPFPGFTGIERAYVQVCNQFNRASSSELLVTVGDGNVAPIVDAGLDVVVKDADGDGEEVVMRAGIAADPEGGAVEVTWFADGEVIGDAFTLVAPLAVGEHVVTLEAMDAEGLVGTSDVVITVIGNEAPVADAGPDIEAEDEGDGRGTVVLDASASRDPEGGALSATWRWTEGGNSYSATGLLTTVELPLGTTQIALEVRDLGGNLATDIVAVTIVPGTPDTVHVADLDGVGQNTTSSKWKSNVTIEVRDDFGQLVTNATVTGTWSKGSPTSSSCITNATGRCTVSSGAVARTTVASIKFTVTAIAAGLPYAPVDNRDPESDSNGTAITVARP